MASFVGRNELANAVPPVAQFLESISHLGLGVGATVEGAAVEDAAVDPLVVGVEAAVDAAYFFISEWLTQSLAWIIFESDTK